MKGILLFMVFLFGPACSNKETIFHYKTISNFQENLTIADTHDSLLKKFGPPSKDIGSGIHIYVYPLKDSTEVWIGYTDKIVYARQVDKKGNIMEELIP